MYYYTLYAEKLTNLNSFTSNRKILVLYGCTCVTWDILNTSPILELLSNDPDSSMYIADDVDTPVILTATWYSESGRITFGAIML